MHALFIEQRGKAGIVCGDAGDFLLLLLHLEQLGSSDLSHAVDQYPYLSIVHWHASWMRCVGRALSSHHTKKSLV
jgi:hypothetical protein